MIRAAVTCGSAERARRYADALRAVGIEPVVVEPANASSLEALGVQGLLLSGGTDVDPALYGQQIEGSEPPDRPRDSMESRLLREALDKDLPVLGICRGLQFFNVFHRGTLVQHHDKQETHCVRLPDPSQSAHEVIVKPRTRLAGILGAGPCAVNSRHHQCAGRVPDELIVSAQAGDGMIEALERPDRAFAVVVQWHPEDQVLDPRQRRLFEAFKEALEKQVEH
jgi:putative glutamine amidotransferase